MTATDRPEPGVPRRELLAARLLMALGLVGLCVGGTVVRITPDMTHLPRIVPVDCGGPFLAAFVLGGVAPFCVRHPYRVIGLIPFVAAGWVLEVLMQRITGTWLGWAGGFASGATTVAAGRFVHRFGNGGLPWLEMAGCPIGVAAVVGVFKASVASDDLALPGGWVLLAVAGISFLLSVLFLPRPLVELGIDLFAFRSYRTRGAGPGIAAFPAGGPVLVIANHACYLDPVFLGQVLPRPVTAMMTATFFDKPIIRPLMVHVFGTIRVSEDPIKRDATELREATDALAAGKCLLIFPEGYLRRKDDVPLKRFGRGVWEVLKAHPDTPVVACWIEGAWGSYFSFKDGPPGENKPRDRRRPIGVGVAAPEPVPADVLADHLTTRLYLMNRVLAARSHLGLPELPPVELPKRGE